MICFFAWDTNIAGGVQNLIINLTSYLIEENICQVFIIGYKESYILKILEKRRLNFNFIDINKMSAIELGDFLKDKVLIITSFSPRLGLYKFIKANPRVLYWNVFPTSLTNVNKFGFINFKYLTRKLVRYLFKNNSCVFMDQNGVLSLSKLFNTKEINNFNIKYLPIPISVENNYYLTRFQEAEDKINISYVGRGSIWKIIPLVKFIEDLNDINLKNKRIVIHIISQEPQKYENYISKIKLNNNISILYKNNLFEKDYKNYLKNNIELHVAMGTAALDGAGLGIPTIVLDFSYSSMPKDYKYTWIHERGNYDLGQNANSLKNRSGKYLINIVFPFLNKEIVLMQNISESCHNYVKRNHDISTISHKLILESKVAEARVRDIVQFTIINSSIFRKYIGKILNQKKYDL